MKSLTKLVRSAPPASQALWMFSETLRLLGSERLGGCGGPHFSKTCCKDNLWGFARWNCGYNVYTSLSPNLSISKMLQVRKLNTLEKIFGFMKCRWFQIGFEKHNQKKQWMPRIPSFLLEQIRIKRFLIASSDRASPLSPLASDGVSTLSCWSCMVSSSTFSSNVLFSACRLTIWVSNPVMVASFSSGQPPLPDGSLPSLTGVM